uniref:Uncharacterized protein n=1 Tax=Quercus lobata TaxID=97700 RepID=A0A7N2LIB6_QUELO
MPMFLAFRRDGQMGLLGDTINSSTRPLLHSPNGRFNLHFSKSASYTYLGVFRILPNDARCIWYSSQISPSANDSDEFILENKDGALRISHQGVNHKTGQNWSLKSRLIGDYIIPGAFTLEWDPKGLELVIKHRGVVHWKSGILRDNQFENISPERTSMYDFNVVSNGDKESFSLMYKSQQSLLLTCVVFPEGTFVENSINGAVLIAGVDKCYGYNIDGGWQRWNQLECRHNGDTVDIKCGFFNSKEDYYYTTPDTNLALSDCQVCLVVGFGEDDEEELVRTDGFGMNRDSDGRPFLSRNHCQFCSVEVGGVTEKMDGSGGGGGGYNETTKEKELCNSVISNRFDDVNEFPNDRKNGLDITIFSYECIKVATNNFSLENKLGEGGFGPIYMVSGTFCDKS